VRLLGYVRADADGERRIGLLTDDGVRDLTARSGATDLPALLSRSADSREIEALADGEPIDPLALRALAPVARPGKIICVGLNYHDHCREQGIDPPGRPLLFAKFSNAITDPGAPVIRPRATEQLDLECELAVVIGRRASRLTPDAAASAVFGYTILNDVTMRDLQREDGQWLRAKGADGFAPLGPVIVTPDELGDPTRLALRSSVNGETWQDSTTAEMVFDIPTLIAFASRMISLEPGDLIATGTPAGVGHFQRPPRHLRDGDVMRCEIERIGALENPVADELPRATDRDAAAGVTELVGATAAS
jgi:2-keto-4-pentenoate hydratase/2-oxohepta-3-ene-1,7-dioic acid hydratase in catechol pathway